MDLKFDTKAVQNWQGFWFSLTTNSIFQYCYTSIITYQVEFPVVHREVSNNIYALSVYYISQIVITVCVRKINIIINFNRFQLFTVHLDSSRNDGVYIYSVLGSRY